MDERNTENEIRMGFSRSRSRQDPSSAVRGAWHASRLSLEKGLQWSGCSLFTVPIFLLDPIPCSIHSIRIDSTPSSWSLISNSLTTISNVSPPSIASSNPLVVIGIRWSVNLPYSPKPHTLHQLHTPTGKKKGKRERESVLLVDNCKFESFLIDQHLWLGSTWLNVSLLLRLLIYDPST